jgi:hypothetical protein
MQEAQQMVEEYLAQLEIASIGGELNEQTGDEPPPDNESAVNLLSGQIVEGLQAYCQRN